MQPLFTRYRQILLGLALFLFGAGGVPRALASHYSAVDLHVDYIGSDSTDLRYRVTLQVYKSCEGMGFSQSDMLTTESVQAASINAGMVVNRPIQITNLHVASFNNPVAIPPFGHGPFDTLDQLCGSNPPLNLCLQPYMPSGTNFPGFIRGTYIDTVTLPARAADWKFIWTGGARSATIINLSPNQGNIWVEAGLNNLEPGRWNNSTPRYTVPPVQYLCVNKPDQFINGPVELPADRTYDSIVTLNVYPQNAGGANYAYTPGYSLANPVGAAGPGGYFVHPVTGTAYFKPIITGKFVLAFRTYEYARAGLPNQSHALMGYVSRDALIATMPCDPGGNPPPTIYLPPVQLTGGILLADSIVSIPVNQTVIMDIGARGADTNGTIGLLADNSFAAPGSQFTATYPLADSAIGHFTWTPAMSDIGLHILPLIAVDTSCNTGVQIPSYAYRNLYLQVGLPTGLGSVGNPGGLKVWPIPAGKVLYLKGTDIKHAALLNATGQLVAAYDRPSGVLDISALPPGIYLVRLTTATGTAYVRFVKE